MTTITCTDLKEGGANKLVGHLKSDDFFGVANHPEAKLVITNVAAKGTPGDYKVTADLTIKETTKKQKVGYQKTGDEIIDALSQQIENAPLVPQHYYKRASALYEREDYALAIDDLNKALAIDSLNPDYYHLLADSYMDYYRSRDNSAILLAPTKAEPRHSKAYYLQNNGDIPGAIELYRDIVVTNPEYSMAYLNSGILYLQQDSLDRAYEQFDILAGREPQNANAYFYRAQVQFIRGDMAAAKMDLQNTLRLSPDDAQALELLKDVEKELAEQG